MASLAIFKVTIFGLTGLFLLLKRSKLSYC